MPATAFDRYYRYDELTELLMAYAAECPDLVTLESIGESHEGRQIWMATVTDHETGSASDKAAFWIDGNIHASEVSASTATLHILDTLCREKPECLRRAAYYLVPRLNPDGAEWALEEPPRVIRSSTRPYPYDEEDDYGIEREDLDGDGRILSIRIKDPNGPWKIAEEEPRLLKKREPGETGGIYYRLIPEGLIHNWDGIQLRPRNIKEGLDLNRNYPSAWRLEHEQKGAGPFPTSEPEVRAMVAAIAERKNVCGSIHFHTFSGVLLRPPSRKPDDEIAPEDLWVFKSYGEKGFELTQYPAISVWHDFKYHPKEVITGDQDDYMYEHVGVFPWTVEIWSPQRAAGITEYKYIEWFRDHPIEDDIKLLAWSEKELGGKGYVDWYAFEHPQLGAVEIGGWDAHFAFRNPPAQFLEAEVAKLTDWAVWLGGTLPWLTERQTDVEKLDGQTRIRFVVQNSGWLPTSVTKLAEEKKMCRSVVGEISRVGEKRASKGEPEPDWLISGKLRETRGQLKGWSHTPSSGFGWHCDSTEDIAVFEWVVESGAEYELIAHHERAGTVRKRIQT